MTKQEHDELRAELEILRTATVSTGAWWDGYFAGKEWSFGRITHWLDQQVIHEVSIEKLYVDPDLYAETLKKEKAVRQSNRKES